MNIDDFQTILNHYPDVGIPSGYCHIGGYTYRKRYFCYKIILYSSVTPIRLNRRNLESHQPK